MIHETSATARTHSSSDRIRTVTTATFHSLVLEAKQPVVVEFMSYGCSHCETIEPILQQVAEMVKSKGQVFRVNIAVERGLAQSYEIDSTPTLLMFMNGKELGRVEGPPPTVSGVLTAITQPFRAMK
jgi:thioredoxin 1